MINLKSLGLPRAATAELIVASIRSQLAKDKDQFLVIELPEDIILPVYVRLTSEEADRLRIEEELTPDEAAELKRIMLEKKNKQ